MKMLWSFIKKIYTWGSIFSLCLIIAMFARNPFSGASIENSRTILEILFDKNIQKSNFPTYWGDYSPRFNSSQAVKIEDLSCELITYSAGLGSMWDRVYNDVYLDKPTESGNNLYLKIMPNGSKHWETKFHLSTDLSHKIPYFSGNYHQPIEFESGSDDFYCLDHGVNGEVGSLNNNYYCGAYYIPSQKRLSIVDNIQREKGKIVDFKLSTGYCKEI